MIEGNGVSASIPTTPPSNEPDTGSGAGTPPDFMSFVPEAYREEPVIKDISRSEKPFENLFEQFKHAHSQIGKTTTGLQVPGEGATPEQVKAFHKALGVPDTIDGYEVPAFDISKEPEELQALLKNDEQSEAYVKAMKELALAEGVPPTAFKKFAEASDKMRVEQAKAMFETARQMQEQKAQQQQEDFKKLYADQSDYVQKIAKETIAKVLPKEVLDTKDPDIALFAAMKFIHEKVYKNDPPAIGGMGTSGNASGEAAIQSEIDALAKDKAYTDRMNPGYDATQVKMQNLYKQLAEAKRK